MKLLIIIWILGITQYISSLAPVFAISNIASKSDQTPSAMISNLLWGILGLFLASLLGNIKRLLEDRYSRLYAERRRNYLFKKLVSKGLNGNSPEQFGSQSAELLLGRDFSYTLFKTRYNTSLPILLFSILFSIIAVFYLISQQIDSKPFQELEIDGYKLYLVIVALFPFCFSSLLIGVYNKKVSKQQADASTQGANTYGRIMELLSGCNTWSANKVFNVPSYFAKKEFTLMSELERARNILKFKSSLFQNVIDTLTGEKALNIYIILILLGFLLGLSSENGNSHYIIAISSIFVAMLLQLKNPISEAGSLWMEKAQLKDMIAPVLELETHPIQPLENVPDWLYAPSLKVTNLEYIIPENNQKVLDVKEVEFSAGSLHVICGPSGSGKSTFFKSLLDLARPEIKLNIDKEITPSEMAKNLAFAEQFVFTIQGTLWENVTLAIRRDVESPLQDEISYLQPGKRFNISTIEQLRVLIVEMMTDLGLTEDVSYKMISDLTASRHQQDSVASQGIRPHAEHQAPSVITHSGDLPQELRPFAALSKADFVKEITNPKNKKLYQKLCLQALDQPLTGYSGGMKKKLLAIRTFLKGAPLVLMDEPGSGLDMVSHRNFLLSLKKYTKGSTVIMISHDMVGIEQADQVHVMNHGEFVQHATYEELKTNEEGFFRTLIDKSVKLEGDNDN